MAWDDTFDITTPAGTDTPTEGDDEIRSFKKQLVTRLNDSYGGSLNDNLGDHNFALTGNELSGADVGKHRQVTISKIFASDAHPSADAGQGILYFAKDGGEKNELFFTIEEWTAEYLQITNDGNLKIYCDDDTIEQHADGYIQLKAGGAGTGILKTHLGTAAGDLCDEDTIENDSSNGLQIKVPAVPSSGADAYPSLNSTPICSAGTYTGTGVDNFEVKVGFDIRHMVIRRTDTSTGAIEAIRLSGEDTQVWYQAESNAILAQGDHITIGKDGNGDAFEGFTLGTNSRVNANGGTYYWEAWGIR